MAFQSSEESSMSSESLPIQESESENEKVDEFLSQVQAVTKQLNEMGMSLFVLPNGEAVVHKGSRGVPIIEGEGALSYLGSPQHADCILVIQPDQRQIYACTDYLSLRSRLFERLFDQAFVESSTRKISLALPHHGLIDQTLEFLYTSTLGDRAMQALEAEHVYNLMDNADYLDSPELNSFCLEIIKQQMYHSPTCDIYISHPQFGPDYITINWLQNVLSDNHISTINRAKIILRWVKGLSSVPGDAHQLRHIVDRFTPCLQTDEMVALLEAETSPFALFMGRGLVSMVHDLKGQIDSLNGKIEEKKGQIGRLEGKIEEVEDQFDKLKNQCATLKCSSCNVELPLFLKDQETCPGYHHPGRYFPNDGWSCCDEKYKKGTGCEETQATTHRLCGRPRDFSPERFLRL